MNSTDYELTYSKIFRILDNYTPLKSDCGVLCGGACCKGDENTGMRLFPFEKSELEVKKTPLGPLVVCGGTCDRKKRPLSCRIFPFFPTIDEKGRIFVEIDDRAKRLCPLVEHCNEVDFDRRFLKAVKKVGKILAKCSECKKFLLKNTEEIDLYRKFLGE